MYSFRVLVVISGNWKSGVSDFGLLQPSHRHLQKAQVYSGDMGNRLFSRHTADTPAILAASLTPISFSASSRDRFFPNFDSIFSLVIVILGSTNIVNPLIRFRFSEHVRNDEHYQDS